MKQLCWNPRRGQAELVELPSPGVGPGQLRVANAFSVISSGTERTTTKVSLRNPGAVLRARPDAVAKLKRIAQTQGIRSAWDMASARLSELQPVGYSTAGVVLEVGAGVEGWEKGALVACAGAGFANHAEEIVVPVNLCVPVPPPCGLEAAAFTTIGAIAMQAFRLSQATVGERLLVIGLGPLGQLCARIAAAAGCVTAGIDPIAGRVERLLAHGASAGWTVSQAPERCDFDAVIVAAGSQDATPLRTAAKLVRTRGRVVALGLFPLELPRDLFYEKEIDFIVSRSTGPGRYDPVYEELGVDYPLPYVRWTEQRNMASFLDLMARERLAVADLISHRFPIDQGVEAYQQLQSQDPAQMAIVLQYPEPGPEPQARVLRPRRKAAAAGASLGVIGVGAFAKSVLLPALQSAGADLASVCSHRPLAGEDAQRRFGFTTLVREPAEIFADPKLAAVVIATRHDSHAELICQALLAGKAVFVEKPLAVNGEQLAAIEAAIAAAPQPARLMVGFNRRFAPLSEALRDHFAGHQEELLIAYRSNSGYIPPHHWVHLAEQGGRIVGEACHFVDWCSYLTGALPFRVSAAANRRQGLGDDVAMTLQYENGAVATILYTAAGGASLGKERVEVFGGGRTAVLEDWRLAQLGQVAKSKTVKRPGKGHREEAQAFLRALREGGEFPISLESLLRTTAATLAVSRSLAEGRAIDLTP